MDILLISDYIYRLLTNNDYSFDLHVNLDNSIINVKIFEWPQPKDNKAKSVQSMF